jgi:hypothetical protein
MSDNIKNCFCFTCMKPINLNGMVCELCFGSNWQCPDENDKDALREWLNPWHPASEPPEKAGYYEVIVLCGKARYITHGYYCDSFQYPYFSIGVCADYDIECYRNLPHLPKKGTT